MQHLDYPDIEFKPSLAIYDYDQTYDLIHIASSYPQIYFNFGTQAIAEFLEGNAILLDRYDYSLFPFAKEYAKKIYDKLSKYNNTQNIVNYNVNGYQSRDKTGIDYGSYQFNDEVITDYQIEWEQEDQAYNGYSCNIILNIPAHDYDIYIAYYGSTYSLPYNTDSVLSLNKCYLKIPATDKSGRVTLKFENTPQICSIIPCRITESDYQELSDIKALFNQLSKGWLYDNLDDLLDIIDDEIQANFKHLDKGLIANSEENLIANLQFIQGYQWSSDSLDQSIVDENITNEINTVFELINLPNWYKDWKIFRSANNQRISDNLQPNYFDDGNDYYLRKSSNTNAWGETVTCVIPSFKKIVNNYGIQEFEQSNIENLFNWDYQEIADSNSFSKFLNYVNPIRNNIVNVNDYSSNHYLGYNITFPYFQSFSMKKVDAPQPDLNFGSTGNSPDLFLFANFKRTKTPNYNFSGDANYTGNYTITHTLYLHLVKLESVEIIIDGTIVKYKPIFSQQLVLENQILMEKWILLRNGTVELQELVFANFSQPTGTLNYNQTFTRTYQTQTFNDTEPQDYFDNTINYLSEYELILMNDSLRTKEIHACLNADKYAWINDNGTAIPATHSLGWKIEKIAQALGILFDLQGNIQSLRQSKRINQGETIAEGWYLGQFGVNEGGQTAYNAQQGGLDTEERLGLAYEIKSNQFTKDPSTGEASLGSSGYVLVESIPQLLHVILQDLDKCLGLQELGAYVVENPNYSKTLNPNDLQDPYFKYEGLGDLIKELAYTISNISKNATQANIGILKTQATTNEILSALGLPTIEKTILINTSEGVQQEVNYPALNPASMSLADLHFIQLQNLALINQGTIELNIKE